MTPARKALRPTMAAAVSVTVLAGTAFGLAPSVQAAAPTPPAATTASASSGVSIRFVDIPGDGGVKLAANVVAPADADASRRLPLVVLPTSWSLPQVEYLAQAKKLAEAGYVVLTYNSRGFWQSGGKIETAGPPDIADASKVIDWALANTPADPDHIGMAGLSYGAGISLLAAGADPRIKAVVAMSGWADLVGSIYSGRTQHAQAAGLLAGAGELTGRPSDELRQILDDFFSSDLAKEPDLIAWGKKRSAAAQLDRINANGAAIMLGNSWGDSIFPPNSYADFFEKLTGPKRLELRPGDHATAELTGLLGLPNTTWSHARQWLDRYLKGERNGIDTQAPVQLMSRTAGGDDYEGYPSWSAVPSGHRRVPLATTEKITANHDSGANAGTVLLSGALDQFLKVPPLASIPLLPRSRAAVWQTGASAREQRVRGTVKLHTTVTTDRSDGTAVAYLYDVGPLGIGKLITNAPVTFHDRTPGTPFGVDLELFSTAYDVPAGHRLALVVDTVDPLYLEHNPDGAHLTFSSPAADPSYLTVPVRD
ncbi:alpha/beta fold hydrolase [Streptomyces violaceusniger]|uniref:S15 family peptidase n=1 Tax=Streptomyces violaceusniger (strain Tu 4113) TaxID=653045 RepID=G2P2R2_STRV4|nr:alpha/beta fold hydrolase [Streptomyces violaceusniger]AEM82185.1 S15 family peptidase [Streptomyces violaceusniger Tu 4113]